MKKQILILAILISAGFAAIPSAFAEGHGGHDGKDGMENGLFGEGPRVLNELNLSADQKTKIEAIFSKTARDQDRYQRKAQRNALGTELLALSKKSTVAVSDVNAVIDSAAAKVSAAEAGHVSTIASLHAVLTPEQRTQFLTKMVARMGANHGKMNGKMGEGRLVNKLSRELKLNETQKKNLEEIVSGIDHQALRQTMMASMADAIHGEFAAATFDQAKVKNQISASTTAAAADIKKQSQKVTDLLNSLDAKQKRELVDELEDFID